MVPKSHLARVMMHIIPLGDRYDFEAVILAQLNGSGALTFITSETKPKWASRHCACSGVQGKNGLTKRQS